MHMPGINEDYRARQRIQWLMTIRLAVITVSLIIGTGVYQITFGTFYYYVYFYYIASLLYIIYLQRTRHFAFLAHFQIAIDLTVVTSIVALTDPLQGVYGNLYLVIIVLSNIVLPRYGGLVTAGLSSALFVGVVALNYYRLPGYYDAQFDRQYGFYITYMYVTVFCGVGYLSNYLSSLVREKSEEVQLLRDQSNYVFRHINTGMLTVSDGGMIDFANTAAERILSLPAELMQGRDWRDVLGVESLDSIHDHRALESGEEVEMVCHNRAGEKVPLAVTYSDIEYPQNSTPFHIVLFRDMRQIKENEAREREAERLNAIVELSATIAHEIRNPLASLSGSAQLLLEELQQQEPRRLAEIIVREGERLNTIVEDFLSYTRLRSLEVSQTDINELVADVVVLLYHSRELPPNVKLIYREREDTLMLPVDAKQLKQALLNLGINALDAMPDGGELELSVHTETRRGMVELRVRDTGIGITPDAISQIFDPFYSTKEAGSGIGLYVTQKVVESHRGSIDVSSTPDQGTTFRIFIPYTHTSEYAGATESAHPRS
jgi:two-component system sensor histidine kinase PilS (NtrC family)